MPDKLMPGEKLLPGQNLISSNGKFALVMQRDGNLVLYRTGSTTALWTSGTYGKNVRWAVLQEDGNFVMYEENKAIWSTGTYGKKVSCLIVQTDGNVVVYDIGGLALWSTDTVVQRMPTPPTQLLPINGASVVAPVSFSWAPGQNNDAIYLNVSTEPNVEPANVINWVDDGTHYFCPDINAFQNLKGKTLYWRLAADCEGERVWTPIQSFVVGDVSIDPYYNMLHLMWPGSAPPWDPHDLSSIKASTLVSYKAQIGSSGATVDRKLGYSFHIPYFATSNIEHYKELLRKVLYATEQAELPVLIGLDGFQWWQGRSDLWNWWDPNKPGFNPDNRYNVEWSSWNPQDAVRDGGLRNWGSPMIMGEPHPNLTSPRVIQANQEALGQLVPIIHEWYECLNPIKKYLFAGIKVGWEISIGVNYQYNSQIGYAAVSTAGIKKTGQLTREDQTKAIQVYLKELSKTLFDAGIPRRKLLTHVGVHPQSCTSEGALTPFAMPGWSFYGEVENLDKALDQINSTAWGNSEWGDRETNWHDAFHSFDSRRNNKLVNNFSFESNIPNDFAEGLRSVIDKIPYWMHPPIMSSETNGRNVVLSWSIPSQATEVYLNVTNNPELKVNGSFVTINIANDIVTGSYRKELNNLPHGTYYWQIVAEGHGRRIASDIGKFQI